MSTIGIPRIHYRKKLNTKYILDFHVENYSSVESLLKDLLKSDAILYYNGNVSYARDMQFDFKTGELYIPYLKGQAYTEETLTESQQQQLINIYETPKIYAEYELEKQVIIKFDKKDGTYKLHSTVLYILVEDNAGNKYLSAAHLEKIPLLTETYKKERPIRELFMLYLKASFKTPESFDRYFKAPYFVHKLLKNNNIPYYKEYITLPKFPQREYSIQKVYQSALLSEEDFYVPQSERRLRYLFLLYFSIVSETQWIGFTRGNIQKLQNHEYVFCKYNEGGISLVLHDSLYLK